MSRRTITPQQHLRTLRAAERMALRKGMLEEAAVVGVLADEVEAKIAQQPS